MKRKKRVGLPRITLLAYSRRDLLAFTEAVETLRHLVDDLRAVAVELSNAAIPKTRKTARRKAGSPPTVSDHSVPVTAAALEGVIR